MLCHSTDHKKMSHQTHLWWYCMEIVDDSVFSISQPLFKRFKIVYNQLLFAHAIYNSFAIITKKKLDRCIKCFNLRGISFAFTLRKSYWSFSDVNSLFFINQFWIHPNYTILEVVQSWSLSPPCHRKKSYTPSQVSASTTFCVISR